MMKTHYYNFKSFKQIIPLLLLGILTSFPGCNATKAQKGAVIGAGTGAAVGGIIGHQKDKTAAGAIIGATVGGAAGALIGRQMDKQAEELRRDLEGADVERVGEGIKITFNSGILFALDSYELNFQSNENLDGLSRTLKKYDDTNILIEGHTDATGPKDYNQDLSEKRAGAVKSFLSKDGVNFSRMDAVGYGESQPVADNDTSEGRQKNRRVEVAIFANEKMKKAAKRGEI